MIITTHRNATVICINVLNSAGTKQPEGQAEDAQNKYTHPNPLHYAPPIPMNYNAPLTYYRHGTNYP